MLKIDKNIPVPRNKNNELVPALKKMKIGESFIVKGEKEMERVRMTYRTHFGFDNLKRMNRTRTAKKKIKVPEAKFKLSVQKQKIGVWRVWKVSNKVSTSVSGK